MDFKAFLFSFDDLSVIFAKTAGLIFNICSTSIPHDLRQIWLLISSEFKQINFFSLMKLLENHRFCVDFKGNRD